MKAFRLLGRESFDYKAIFSKHIAVLRSVQSPQALMKSALSSLREIFMLEDIGLLLKDDEQYVLRVMHGALPTHYQLSATVPLIKRLAAGDRLLAYDELDNPHYEVDRGFLKKDFVNLKAAAMLPLKVDGRLLGVVVLGCPIGRRVFDEAEKELLELLAYEMAFAVQNAALNETVMKQRKQLEELSTLKNTFVANMTHELTTPLHHMIGLAQALAEGADGDLNGEQQGHLMMIVRAGEHLLDLHRSILDLSRLDSGGLQLNVKKMNICELMGEILPAVEAEAALKKTVIHDRIPKHLPPVYIDEDKIKKVIQVLMDNASCYTSNGEIRIQGVALHDRIKLCIEDTGVGIDPAFHGDIFDTFRQVDVGTSRQSNGTGMGLALAKKIIELHGERIWLESEPDRGSRFFFTLPTRAANIPAFKMTD